MRKLQRRAKAVLALASGSYVLNTTTGEKERIGRIVRMFADKREEISKVEAGDIAAVVGLKSTATGNTLAAVSYTHLDVYKRQGHIQLVVPVAHIWYFRSLPNKIGYLLGLPTKKLFDLLK